MISKILAFQIGLSVFILLMVNAPYFTLREINIAVIVSFLSSLFVYFYVLYFHMKKDGEVAVLKKTNVQDHLTNLYNRRYLDKLLAGAYAENAGFSVIMLDIDHFKRINDNYGHDKGDDVLRTFARIMADSVRAGDYCARFGGEEFMVLLLKSELRDAVKAAMRIKERTAKTDISGVGHITASMGVVEFDKEEDCDIEGLIKNVDELLYMAKENGRNRIVLRGKNKISEIT